MAKFIVLCQGSKWQDDFVRVYDDVRRYFNRVFRQRKNREDEVQDALAWFCESFAARWEHGKELVCKTYYAKMRVLNGRLFARGGQRGGPGYRKPIRKTINLHEVKDDAANVDADIDFAQAWSQLSEDEKFIILKVLEGIPKREIERRWGIDHRKTRKVIRKLLSLL